VTAPGRNNPGIGGTASEPSEAVATPDYGLRRNVLGPLESVAQSISTMAPTASAAMTVPLVFASAGNGTWLAYLIATICTMPVALCVARFARESTSPGSLYTYTTSSLPPVLGSVAAWSLLVAYVATGVSVVGGFIHYANVVLGEFFGLSSAAAPLAIAAVAVSVWFAYRDVKVSASLMLYVEIASVVSISTVFGLLLWHHGLHVDSAQVALRGIHFSGVRLAVVLAMFSFAGFESATTLGEEVRDPLRTIPRSIIQSALISGLFFITASYVEVLGFPASAGTLDQSDAPMTVLATAAGVGPLGRFIDVGVMVTMLACTLACITAAARVLMLMGHNGLAPRRMGATHPRNRTPYKAVVAIGGVTFVLAIALVAGHVSGETIYDWMGSLAVYGFVTVYALVAVALPVFLRQRGRPIAGAVVLAALSVLAMALVLEGTLYPVPDPPKNRLPYYFLLFLVVAAGWNEKNRRGSGAARA
jgi:amino acid transporter